MKKIILLLILLSLTSCGNDSKEQIPDGGGGMEAFGMDNNSGEKTEFYIETTKLSDYSSGTSIEKVGKVLASENIEVSSQVSGEISEIYVKEGENIKAGDMLGKIEDLYSQYSLSLESAQISYDSQLINKKSQIVSLDQKIKDAEISLEEANINLKKAKADAENDEKQAEIDLENAKLDAQNDKKQADIDLENAQLVAENNKKQAEISSKSSSLSSENSQAQIEYNKAQIDYENTILSNKEQINTYINNIKKEYNNLYLNLTDIIRFSDEILGVTEENKNKNDSFEDYLGFKNIAVKLQAEDSLLDLINYKNEIEDLDLDSLNEENIVDFMDSYYSGYEKINTSLGYLENTINGSIEADGYLDSSDISSYLSKIDSYQSSNQSNLSSFNSTKSSVMSFLNTYKQTEESALENLNLQKTQLEDNSNNSELTYEEKIASIEKTLKTAEINYENIINSIKKTLLTQQLNYENTINSIANNISNYEIKYTQAQKSYNNALENKEVTILSLDNSIVSALNTLKKQRVEYSKLTITSPISGIVSSIDVDKNTQVSAGTNLFEIAGSDNTKIEVALSSSEIKTVEIGDKVEIDYLDKEYYGEVYSKSSVANSNLEYKVVILVSEKLELIGASTMVKFISQNKNIILPVDIIEINGEDMGTINYLEGQKALKLEVSLGKMDGSNIEILSEIPTDIEIITTDLKNYNELNQTLKVNN